MPITQVLQSPFHAHAKSGMASTLPGMASADVFVFGATAASGSPTADASPVQEAGVQALTDVRTSATDKESPAARPHTTTADTQQDKGQPATGQGSGTAGPAVALCPTPGEGSPAQAGQEGQGKLAEYFGVVFTPGSASPARSPTGRVRRTVGHLNTMTPSPPGPLEASMRAGMAAMSREIRREKLLSERPGPPLIGTPTREELVSVHTRAMLELRVSIPVLHSAPARVHGTLDSAWCMIRMW